VAEEVIPLIEARRINPEKPGHVFRQIGVWSFHNEVEVIGHQAKSPAQSGI
jgi:hypothetical protein